jgi:uncharacterized membrane protein
VEKLYIKTQYNRILMSLVIIAAIGIGFAIFYCGLLAMFKDVPSLRATYKKFFITDGIILPLIILLIPLQRKYPQYMS